MILGNKNLNLYHLIKKIKISYSELDQQKDWTMIDINEKLHLESNVIGGVDSLFISFL